MLAAVLGGVAIGMNVGKVPLALPAMRLEFGLSLVEAGLVSSMLGTLAVVTALGFGLLAGRVGAWRLAMAGLLLGALASAWGIWASGFATLISSRLLEGAGFLAVAVAGPGLVSAATAPADRRFALGAWATYMPAGAGLGLALSPLLMGLGGWRALWAAASVLLLLAAAAAWHQRAYFSHGPAASGSTHAMVPDKALALLRQPLPWLLSFAFAAWALQHFALIIWLPTFLTEQRGLSPGPVAALSALMLLANVPGNLIGGALVQRGYSRGHLIAFAHTVTGLFGLGLALDAWPDSLRYGLCVALSFVGGLIPAAVMSSSTVLTRNPAQIGLLQGLIMQGSQLGQFVGTPLIAWVVTSSGQWSSARWVTTAAAVLGLALGLAAHRAEKRLPPAPA